MLCSGRVEADLSKVQQLLRLPAQRLPYACSTAALRLPCASSTVFLHLQRLTNTTLSHSNSQGNNTSLDISVLLEYCAPLLAFSMGQMLCGRLV